MKRRFFPLLGAAALLLGAAGDGHWPNPLPRCGDNTYLGFVYGQLGCLARLPDCTGQLLTARPGGDFYALYCTPKLASTLTDADRQRLVDLQAALQAAAAELSALGLGPTLAALYVGNTVATTAGRIEHPGSDAGLPAANAYCAAEFGPQAHMCALPELFGAVLNSTFDPGTDVALAWLYMPTWNAPLPGAQFPLSGLGDNCGGYTDGTDANGWSGMAVDWNLEINGARVLHFLGSTAAPCSQRLPIACCQ